MLETSTAPNDVVDAHLDKPLLPHRDRSGPVKKEDLTNPAKEKAMKAANSLLDKKVEGIIRKRDTKGVEALNEGEASLFLADTLKTRGFKLESYHKRDDDGTVGVKLEGGLKVTTQDGREVSVTHLTGHQTIKNAEGQDVISYSYRDPADKDNILYVTGDELYDSQLASEAETISKIFPVGEQRDIVSWLMAGGTGEVPGEDKIKAAEAQMDADPFHKADIAINQQISALSQHLLSESLPTESQKAIKALIAELRLSEITNGDIGRLFKINALKRSQKQFGSIVEQDIKSILDDLEPQKDEAEANLIRVIENSEQKTGKVETWKKLASDPEGLKKLFADPEFMNLPDMTTEIFGKEMTGTDALSADQLISDFGRTHLSDEDQQRLWDITKKTRRGMLWVLAALLAIPAVALATITVGVTQSIGHK